MTDEEVEIGMEKKELTMEIDYWKQKYYESKQHGEQSEQQNVNESIMTKQDNPVDYDGSIQMDVLRLKSEEKLDEHRLLTDKLNSLKTQANTGVPFNRLHTHVQWEILKNLDFKAYRNLALTCRYWYHTASSAPDYVKPNLKFGFIKLRYLGLFLDDRIHFSYFPSLRLINSIKCNGMYIELNANFDFVRFIQRNKRHFSAEGLDAQLFPITKDQLSTVYDMSTMAQFISVFRRWKDSHFYIDSEEYDETCDSETVLYFQNCLSHRCIQLCLKIDTKTANTIIKQWVKGERPKCYLTSLIKYETVVDNSTLVDEMTVGLEEYVCYRHELSRERGHKARIIVAGRPKFLRICVSQRLIKFEEGFTEDIEYEFRHDD